MVNKDVYKIKVGEKFIDRVDYMDIDKDFLNKLKNCLKNKYPYKNLSISNMNGEDWKKIKWLEDLKKQYTGTDKRCKDYKSIDNAWVSNKGRVKFEINGKQKIISQNDDIEPGYLRLVGYPGFGYVYRLVAETWLVEEQLPARIIVHHIDNDGYNNNVENLILVTPYQHGIIHANGNY